jgi:hypothetical protein
MDFTFEGNYKCTLTQGVSLSANPKKKIDFKRKAVQTASTTSMLGRFETFSRKCIAGVVSSMSIGHLTTLCRSVIEQVNLTVEKWETREYSRLFSDGVGVESGMGRKQSIFRQAQELVSGADSQEFTVLFYRGVMDTAIVTQANSGIRGFIREVKSSMEVTDGIESGAGFYRYSSDMVSADSSLFRKVAILVRIASQLFLSDLFLGRFLRAKKEVILKSCVTRELTIESRIN